MVKERMISYTRPSIVEATQHFLAKYFDDEITALTINSSDTSKQRTYKGSYNIDFVYEGPDGLVPQFIEEEGYASRLKKEYTEWLGKEVKYLSIEWCLVVDKSVKKDPKHSFSFTIDLRV